MNQAIAGDFFLSLDDHKNGKAWSAGGGGGMAGGGGGSWRGGLHWRIGLSQIVVAVEAMQDVITVWFSKLRRYTSSRSITKPQRHTPTGSYYKPQRHIGGLK